MSGFRMNTTTGEITAAPECEPGAHEKLWTRNASGGLSFRCDACMTIMTMTAEAAGRLRAMVESYDFPIEGKRDPELIDYEDGTQSRRSE